MGFWKDLIGDVTTGIEQVVPGAKQLDQFLNKVGIGPQTLQDPLHPSGWAGDIEHGSQQFAHSPEGRALEEAAAIAAAIYFAPELAGTIGSEFSAADMEAIAQAGAEYTGETAAATSYGADLAAETAAAVPETAAGTTAATSAAAQGANMMPELTAQASRLPMEIPQWAQYLPSLLPMIPGSLQGAPNPYRAPTAKAQGAPDSPQATPSGDVPPPDAGPGPFWTAPETGIDVSQALAGPDVMGPPPGGLPFNMADPVANMGIDPGTLPDITPGPGWGQQALDFLKTPRGALTGVGTAASLYSLLHKASLPGYAQQAGAVAGPAVAQAQAVIASGGMGTPLWNTQKASIDAQIDQQISNMKSYVQQNAQNQGMGGSNSAAVQAMISNATGQLETRRQEMYQQVLQQNVTNAVSELTGANQTLMSLAQMQLAEYQYAEQLAAAIGNSTFRLASLWPGT